MLARASIAATRHSGFYFWTMIMVVVVIPASQLAMAIAYDHGLRHWGWPEWNPAVLTPAWYQVIFLFIPSCPTVGPGAAAVKTGGAVVQDSGSPAPAPRLHIVVALL